MPQVLQINVFDAIEIEHYDNKQCKRDCAVAGYYSTCLHSGCPFYNWAEKIQPSHSVGAASV